MSDEVHILKAYKDLVLDYDTRITVLYGGAGSGKSMFGVQKYVIKALRSQRKILVVRKVGSTLKSSIWALTVEILLGINGAVRNINKSEMQIELVNGSVFIFKGLDDPEKIKSIQGITDILIEEATELSLDDFTQLNLRLRSNEPYNQITLMFNPVSKANWCFKYFFENGAPTNCKILKTTYEDNPHLPEEYIASIMELKERNPAYYKIYVKGEFATLDKLVFPVVEKRIVSEEEIKGLFFWCGLDWGFTNDETAITWGFFNPNEKIIYITGEYNKKGMTNDVIYNTLESLGLAKERIIADSSEPKSIEELRRFGARHIKGAIKGPDSVTSGIDKMLRCKIIVDERCIHTIEEFDNYTWSKDKSTGEYTNKPVDAFNHHIDSIRYGIQDVYKKKLRSEDELRRAMFL